jgi:hypothetical protein
MSPGVIRSEITKIPPMDEVEKAQRKPSKGGRQDDERGIS